MQDTLTKNGLQNTEAEAEDILQMVGLVVADELFGVDILMVKEIIKNASITAIPDAPNFIEGIINLRGSIIPIINLRERLKLPHANKPADDDVWIIILDIGGRVTGFIVDKVTRVLKIQANMVKPPPDLVVSGLKSDYIRGVCKQEQQLLAILDFNRILLVDEFKKLSAMQKKKAS